jgi:hypothetical protein
MATLLGRNLFLYVGGNKVGKELSHTFSRDFNFLEKRGLFVDRQIIMTDKAGDVSLSFILDYDASNSYKTLVSSAESQALLTFAIKTGVSGDPEITFQGNIIQYRQQADLDSVMRVEVSIVINGPVQVLVGGAYKIKSTNIDEISVYSLEEGSVPYVIRNTVTGVITSGTLTFAAPAITGGIADGYFSDAITGLTSGTKYELTVGLGIAQEIWTQFNFTVLAADQHLFSSAAPDYLTETDIGAWGLPKTVNQVESGGVANDFSGNGNHGAVKDSTAASVLVAATLTFSNTSPYIKPTAVTIGGGTATASGYDSGTGVLTIDGSGTIEYLVVDGVNVYMSSNAGMVQRWKQNSIQYQILFSAVTFTTTNNNAFNQAKGATKHPYILPKTTVNLTGAPTAFPVTTTFKFITRLRDYSFLFGLPGGQDLIRGFANFRYDMSFTGFRAANSSVYSPVEGGILVSESEQGDLFEFDVLTTCTGSIINQQDFILRNLTKGTTKTRTVTGLSTNIASGSVGFLVRNDGTNNAFAIEYQSYDIGNTGVLDYEWQFNESTRVYDTLTGAVNCTIAASAIRDGYSPSALDASGNPTGLDVQGNALPTGYGSRFFDFGNSLEWKATPVTETYGDLPPPIVGVTEYGAEFVTDPNAKSDIISIPAGAGASLDAEILKYLAAIQADSLPKIIKRA